MYLDDRFGSNASDTTLWGEVTWVPAFAGMTLACVAQLWVPDISLARNFGTTVRYDSEQRVRLEAA